MTLKVKFSDLLRATLSFRTGNESWIGFSPDGNSYHIVSPVDTQISKGVMACNRPKDGTPFGGYIRWLYFRIPPFGTSTHDDEIVRKEHAKMISEGLIRDLRRFGIEAEIDGNGASSADLSLEKQAGAFKQDLVCSGCSRKWNRLADCLRDPLLIFVAYRACIDDFSKGVYVFEHNCLGHLHISASSFVRRRPFAKSLAGFQGCPGFCYYEHSFQECRANCEGSCYRRIAVKLHRRSDITKDLRLM